MGSRGGLILFFFNIYHIYACLDVYIFLVVVFSDGSGFETHSGMSHKGLTGCVQKLNVDGLSAGIIRSAQLHNVQKGCNAPRLT